MLINVALADNGAVGSDSDTSSDDSPEYYQPITTADGGENEGEFSDEDGELDHHQLPNGYASLAIGVSSIDLSDSEDEVEEEEEEEEMMQETAIERALREDESRRTAPLTAENAGRVMEAMRGISFGGSVPDWAGRVSEDEWIHQLRSRLRRPTSDPSSINH
ncbi:hypothetical protein ACJIZ3_012449 [Penstemon smallii]|uniref:Uncharacterized protein n=1 Tax=Penstemon smallii TaxID=265156 RepID=A0ABD3UQP7_9LAMI